MTPRSIVIDGTPQGLRYLVNIDDEAIHLQAVCFRCFALLGVQLLLQENDGWVHASDMYRPAYLSPAYIYRLRQNIHNESTLLQDWPVVENDYMGNYRLLADPSVVTIDSHGLYDFDDYALGQMVDKLLLQKTI